MRQLMVHGHTRKYTVCRSALRHSCDRADTKSAMSVSSPTKRGSTEQVLQLRFTPTSHERSIITSCLGSRDSGYRERPTLSRLGVSYASPTRSCTCAGEDHPGPSVSVGRGAPEIDILEVERNKTGALGQVVSQSAQFAPFTHDYNYGNATEDQFTIYTPDLTLPNHYK